MDRKDLLIKIMEDDEKSGLYESVYERGRNKLNMLQMVLDLIKLDSKSPDKGSTLQTAYDNLEDVKEILNQLERKHGKSN